MSSCSTLAGHQRQLDWLWLTDCLVLLKRGTDKVKVCQSYDADKLTKRTSHQWFSMSFVSTSCRDWTRQRSFTFWQLGLWTFYFFIFFTHQQKTKYCIITTSVFNNLGYNNCIWENTLCFVGKSLNKHPLPSSPFRTPSSGNTPYNSFSNDGPQFYHFYKCVFFLW